ncbi:MAG TPA: hypothetical protein VG106_14280, partial [Vicinamibacterales bacterium]|nr:hypothetical protein [Vicinamibacterales bacterium]
MPARLLGRLRAFLQPAPTERLPALTRSMLAMPVAESYLAAHAESRHRRAGAAAASASSQALAAGDWGAADVWARHALWQFERAGMVLHAARAARASPTRRAARAA